MRKKVAEDKKANYGTKCGSQEDKGRNRKKAGKPNRRQTDKDGLWKSKWIKMDCGNFGLLFRGMLV